MGGSRASLTSPPAPVPPRSPEQQAPGGGLGTPVVGCAADPEPLLLDGRPMIDLLLHSAALDTTGSVGVPHLEMLVGMVPASTSPRVAAPPAQPASLLHALSFATPDAPEALKFLADAASQASGSPRAADAATRSTAHLAPRCPVLVRLAEASQEGALLFLIGGIERTFDDSDDGSACEGPAPETDVPPPPPRTEIPEVRVSADNNGDVVEDETPPHTRPRSLSPPPTAVTEDIQGEGEGEDDDSVGQDDGGLSPGVHGDHHRASVLTGQTVEEATGADRSRGPTPMDDDDDDAPPRGAHDADSDDDGEDCLNDIHEGSSTETSSGSASEVGSPRGGDAAAGAAAIADAVEEEAMPSDDDGDPYYSESPAASMSPTSSSSISPRRRSVKFAERTYTEEDPPPVHRAQSNGKSILRGPAYSPVTSDPSVYNPSSVDSSPARGFRASPGGAGAAVDMSFRADADLQAKAERERREREPHNADPAAGTVDTGSMSTHSCMTSPPGSAPTPVVGGSSGGGGGESAGETDGDVGVASELTSTRDDPPSIPQQSGFVTIVPGDDPDFGVDESYYDDSDISADEMSASAGVSASASDRSPVPTPTRGAAGPGGADPTATRSPPAGGDAHSASTSSARSTLTASVTSTADTPAPPQPAAALPPGPPAIDVGGRGLGVALLTAAAPGRSPLGLAALKTSQGATAEELIRSPSFFCEKDGGGAAAVDDDTHSGSMSKHDSSVSSGSLNSSQQQMPFDFMSMSELDVKGQGLKMLLGAVQMVRRSGTTRQRPSFLKGLSVSRTGTEHLVGLVFEGQHPRRARRSSSVALRAAANSVVAGRRLSVMTSSPRSARSGSTTSSPLITPRRPAAAAGTSSGRPSPANSARSVSPAPVQVGRPKLQRSQAQAPTHAPRPPVPPAAKKGGGGAGRGRGKPPPATPPSLAAFAAESAKILRIQCAVRRFLARLRQRRLREAEDAAFERYLRTEATLKIQRFYREKRGLRYGEHQRTPRPPKNKGSRGRHPRRRRSHSRDPSGAHTAPGGSKKSSTKKKKRKPQGGGGGGGVEKEPFVLPELPQQAWGKGSIASRYPAQRYELEGKTLLTKLLNHNVESMKVYLKGRQQRPPPRLPALATRPKPRAPLKFQWELDMECLNRVPRAADADANATLLSQPVHTI